MGIISHRQSVRLVAAGASTVAAVALTLAGPPALAASTPPGSTSYPGSAPSWADSRHRTGAPAAATTVEGEIYFRLRDLTGAKAVADAVSTPGSGRYRDYLEPEDWISDHAPAESTVDKTVDWLRSKGLSIIDVPESRLFVVFRGTASQIGSAFAAELADFDYDGTTLIGPSKPPEIPTDLAQGIQAVSLDQGRLLTRPSTVSPDPAPTPGAVPPVTAPCSNYWGQNTATMPAAYGTTVFPTRLCGYTPTQIESAYGVASPGAVNRGAGAGETVAIIDAYASPSIVGDTNIWSRASGVPALSGEQYRQIAPPPAQFADQALCGGPSGWQIEQSLDVQAVHGMAPGAGILYVGGYNCAGGLDIAMSTILDGRLADIVSNSYGAPGEAMPPEVLAGEYNLHLQAAAEGIGLYFSSGDHGDEAAVLGFPSPDFPASSPYVTSVGGTSLGVGKDGSYLFETGWGTVLDRVVRGSTGALGYAGPLPGAFYAGAGGGVSAVFAEPAYQARLVPAQLSAGFRVSPDIASLADPYTGYRIGLSPIVNDTSLTTGPFGFQTVGGTSLACPLAAAEMATAQAHAYRGIGFANPAIYALASAGGQHDIIPPPKEVGLASSSTVSGNTYLVTLGHDTTLRTAPGYDDVTGVGSMTQAFADSVASLHGH